MKKGVNNISLDKWIKTEKKRKNETNNNNIVKTKNKSSKKNIDKNEELVEISEKFELTCKNAKCKYKKILKKKRISERDIICPRCKNEMKVKKI